MASELSAYATLYDAAVTSRIAGPSTDDREFALKLLTDSVTLTEAANSGHDTYLSGDYYDLGPVHIGGQVIPNLSFLSYDTGSTGTLTNAHFVLARYNATDGAVVLTGIADASGAVADYFLDFAAATTWPTIEKGDRLRLYLANTEGTYTAGRQIRVNVVYIPKHSS